VDRTLLLNPSYEPIAAISWKRAICLLVLGKVETVEEYDRQVRSAKSVFPVPAVVRLVGRFKRHRRPVKFSKQNIFARDRYKCLYCGASGTDDTLTCDHVVPRSRGGVTCFQNIATCCRECNARKADMTPQEAGLALCSVPYAPDWVPLVFRCATTPPLWKPYLIR
jgi:5-methylcytosine-specific restriction endonuclease McrA